MFKTDKGAKKGKKFKLLIAIVVLALAATGIILGITYWPAKSSNLIGSFNESLNCLSITKEGQDACTVYNFVKDNLDEMKQKASEDTSEGDMKDVYAAEMESFSNIAYAAENAIFFYKNTIESSVKGKLKRGDVKNISKNLQNGNKELNSMAKHIKNHSNETVNFTLTTTIWEGIREYFKSFLEDYTNAFKTLSEIYSTQTLTGIYGNDVTMLSVKAMYNYIDVVRENLVSQEEGFDASIAVRASKDANKFSLIYGAASNSEIKTINITSYFNSEICQKNISYVLKMEKETDNKVSFKYLIQNNFSVRELSLTASMQKYTKPSVHFLKGEDLTENDYVGDIDD